MKRDRYAGYAVALRLHPEHSGYARGVACPADRIVLESHYYGPQLWPFKNAAVSVNPFW